MMTAPRFEVLKRDPHVWHVLDNRLAVIDVIVFPLDRHTVAHARARVDATLIPRWPEVLEAAERKLERYLQREGYRVVRRPPLVATVL